MIVVWQPPARSDLRRLDPPIARQIRDAVLRFAATGQGDVSRLRPPLEGFRLRSGDWRVRFRFDGPDLIHVQHLRHRSQAYR